VAIAVRAYAGATRARQVRLQAMYAAKVEYARARARYRRARRAYDVACRLLQAAKARLEDAQRLYDNAFRSAYIDWCARHPRSSHGDRLQAVRELARLRRVSVTQMARLLGYRAERTPREVAEDLHRYLAGTPVLAIARERGISRQAVYDQMRQHKARIMELAQRAREGLNGDIAGR